MASKKNSRSRRKTLFAAEMVILVLLTIALFGAIFVTHKLSLVNYDTNFDSSKVKTSKSVNGQKNKGQSETAGAGVAEEEEEEAEYVEEEYDSGLTGIDTIALVGLDTRPDSDEGGNNSDTMMICVINHNEKTIKLVSIYRDTWINIGSDWWGDPNYYTKANAAFNIGGPEQFLSMVNLNLDLDITEYASVEFKALAVAIEMLGGLDVELTAQEIAHLNNYNVETSAACDMPYVEIPEPSEDELFGYQTATYHLNGSQAVSYARIRYTDGFDFRRASRQRVILSLLKEKARQADVLTLNNVLNNVLPLVTTNMDSSKIMSMAIPVLSYKLTSDDQAGFPFVHVEDVGGAITGEDCVLPVTLQYNVERLHEFLYPGYYYYPSDTVIEYSNHIIAVTGFDESTIAAVAQNYDEADIPAYTDLRERYSAQQGIPLEGETAGEEFYEDGEA